MAIFKGAGVAIITPMHEDVSVNYEILEEILEFLLLSRRLAYRSGQPSDEEITEK